MDGLLTIVKLANISQNSLVSAVVSKRKDGFAGASVACGRVKDSIKNHYRQLLLAERPLSYPSDNLIRSTDRQEPKLALDHF
jgi:hypothetical protein